MSRGNDRDPLATAFVVIVIILTLILAVNFFIYLEALRQMIALWS